MPKKNIIVILVAFLVIVSSIAYDYLSVGKYKNETGIPPQMPTTASGTLPLVQSATTSELYTNTQYGFTLTLPKSWKNYSVVKSKWTGLAIGQIGETPYTTGPQISIRHPGWTSTNPRQDIPVMIFTQKQWNDLQHEVFHIGAAPILPSELGRNANYIFALPARYNFAFLTGFEEVQRILDTKPLHGF